jgi:hypothetical protein
MCICIYVCVHSRDRGHDGRYVWFRLKFKGFTHRHAISVLGDSCTAMSLRSGAGGGELRSYEQGGPPLYRKVYSSIHMTSSLFEQRIS